MDSRTYGSIPTYPEFKALFKEMSPPHGYRIKGVSGDIDGTYDDQELFGLVVKLKVKWENGDEKAGQLASDILFSLGVEWV
ncbi:MAG: hypothetical protein ACXAEN_26300 [Candidatus Thorarchaeota archaeon]|jgi:hypothetical protein